MERKSRDNQKLLLAIKDVKQLNKSIRTAADKHGIPKTNLSRIISMLSTEINDYCDISDDDLLQKIENHSPGTRRVCNII